MTPSVTRTALAATGAVVAAVVSTLCCAGPLVAVALGLSGAGLAATFEPLRPYFIAGTVLALAFGFVELRREEKRACEPGTLCLADRPPPDEVGAVGRHHRRDPAGHVPVVVETRARLGGSRCCHY